MTLILGLSLCLLALGAAYFAGHWMGYDKGWDAGIDAASGKPVTPLRPRGDVAQRFRNRGGDGAA